MISASTSAFIFIVITPSGRAWLADQRTELVAQVHRGDEQLAVLAGAAVAGEVVEELGDVVAELVVDREHAEVLVEHRGLGVVVAGADVAVAADAVGLLAHDEQDLGVGLQADEAVHDVRAGLLQHPGPLDVGLLLEARLELDERHHLLARFGRLHERRDDAGLVAAGPVERLLDREHVRIARGLRDEGFDRGRERVVRVVEQHVAVADRPEDVDVVAAGERRRCLRRERRELELRAGAAQYSACRPLRSSGPSITYASPGASSSSRHSSWSTSGVICASTSRRTAAPNLVRWRSTNSIAASRSSASSESSKSASRVTRNA